MKWILITTLILAAELAVALKMCPKPNEEFHECGTACPDTCENLNPKEPIKCTLQCVIGCACQEGYVLNAQKECIKPSECPKSS